MDRGAAMWEAWFIEGLADGRYAVFHKVHHCLKDGQGAARLLDYMFEEEPGAPAKKVPAEIAVAQAGDIPGPWRKMAIAAWRLSSLPAKASLEINGIFLQKFWRKLSGGSKKNKAKPSVPNAAFNAGVGADRGLVYCSLPLADIKAVKDYYRVTVNDVILATAIDDPADRLRAIAEDSGSAKEVACRGTRGAMEIQQMLPPILNAALAYIAPPEKGIAELMSTITQSVLRYC